MNAEKASYYFVLFIAAIFSTHLVWQRYFVWHQEAPANPNNPDEFAQNVTIVRTDVNGQIESKFYSPKVLHYAPNDRTVFFQPLVTMYPANNEAPWVAKAQQGEALTGGESIRLWGDVTITQAATLRNPSSVITTNSLMLYPQTRLITTTDYIQGSQASMSMSGVGMRLDMDQHTLDLLAQVVGHYVQQNGVPIHVTSNSSTFNNLTHQGVFRGAVNLVQGKSHLWADQLSLQANSDNHLQIAVATGNAKLLQDSDTYTAPEIYYDINQQMVTSPSSKHGRTTIVIQPQTLQKR